MTISVYMSIIVLNVIGLNASIKKHRVTEWIQIQHPLHAAYKRLILDLKVHTDSKWENGKIYSMKMVNKKSWGINTYIRWNRLWNTL